jgi:hypothetical protein
MEQLGQKFGEHMSDDPGYGSPEAYADLARSIYNNPNAVASIASNGDTLLQVGSNILRLQPDGSFRSLYPQQ